MNNEEKREFVKMIAEIVPDPEFVYYIYNMVKTDDQKRKLLKLISHNQSITRHELNVMALDISLGRK